MTLNPYISGPQGGGSGGLDEQAVDDRVSELLTAGPNVALAYDDGAGTLTIAVNVGDAALESASPEEGQSLIFDGEKWVNQYQMSYFP